MTALQRALLRWYVREGRASLPWRRERSAYRTLVSEFMLQQTQVDRVVPKFEAFIEQFPAIESLAAAPRGEVLRAWRGLGYNARAVRLHGVAQAVVARHDGVIPRDREALLALGGIGPYTAAAIRAFAYDVKDVPLDVNLTRVTHRLLFGIEYPPKAKGAALREAALALVPRGRAHDWGSALMDLGATICTSRAPRCMLCPVRSHCRAAPLDATALDRARAKHAPVTKARERFELTNRHARGRIIDRLRELPPGERISLLDLHRELRERLAGRTRTQLRALVEELHRDGLLVVQRGKISLP